MPLELFIPKAFNVGTRKIIRQANAILDEYRERGFVLTLRQLYYQFVHRGFIPNTQKEYKRLGYVINDARLAGRIDWEMIEDRTRNLMSYSYYDNPTEIIQRSAYGYRLDIWESQPVRPEVWIEKEALTGVIEPVCNELRVPYFACKGFTSQSEQWRAGRRLASYMDSGQRALIIHLGDHDPSGIDMTRDNGDRLAMFARSPNIDVRRVALNMDQVEEFRLAPNPAKITDSRYKGYAEIHGNESWELDALDPTKIDELIRDTIESVRDVDAWAAVEDEEREAQRLMQQAAGRWADVTAFLNRPDYE